MDTNTEPNTATATATTTATTTATAAVKLSEEVEALLGLARSATVAYDRQDLTHRIDRANERFSARQLTVLVVGEFKQGKSTLVNALLNVSVCGVADDVSTVVPTILRHGAEPSAAVRYVTAGDVESRVEQVDLARVAQLGTEQGNAGNAAAIREIEVTVPRQLLESGLTIIDTPGVGGLDAAHAAVTGAALALAEVIVFVTDASQPLTRSELDFLQTAGERCPNLVIVQPKIDIQPAWRQVVEANTAILREHDLAVDILPVSSVLRQQAAVQRSTELNHESGFPPLIALLRDAANGEAARISARTALGDVAFVAEQMQSTFEHQVAALDDPATAEEMIAQLEAAKQRADHLRGQSAKWQQTLNDGAQDLASDMDHDLRMRFRAIVSDADAALEAQDPTDVWDEFEQWLHRRIGYDLSAHYLLIAERANELAATVADHFAEDEAALGVQLDLAVPTIAARALRPDVKLQRAGVSDSALAAVRGSYGGLLMVGMVGQMAGLALLNPFSVLVGIGLGRRGLRDEKRRQLVHRQQQAKMTTRKYLDDVNVEAGKGSRDTARRAHRELRDEFSSRAEQLQATIRESLRCAETATKEALADRQRHVADARAELDRLTRLRTRTERLREQVSTSPAEGRR